MSWGSQSGKTMIARWCAMAGGRRLGQNVSANHSQAAIPAQVRCLRFYPSVCNRPTLTSQPSTLDDHSIKLTTDPQRLQCGLCGGVDDQVRLVGVCEAPWMRLRAAMETLGWYAGHATRAHKQGSSSAPVDTSHALSPSRGSNRHASWDPACPPPYVVPGLFRLCPMGLHITPNVGYQAKHCSDASTLGYKNPPPSPQHSCDKPLFSICL